MNAIGWCDYTTNPGIGGCEKISPACQNCYAMGMARRLYHMHPDSVYGTPGLVDDRGNWTGKVVVDYDAIGPAFAKLPKRAHRDGRRRRVFVTSMADLFHVDVPRAFIDEVFLSMAAKSHLDFLVLTKRAARLADNAERLSTNEDRWPPNIWVGVTAEDQQRANERIPHLLKVPSTVRFVSYEPALGPVDWTRLVLVPARTPRHPEVSMNALTGEVRGPDDLLPGIDWLICGGESGPKARPMDPDWARQARDQCREAGVPFYFKQMSKKAPIPDDLMIREFPGGEE